jgi:hypothetical protein
MSRSVVSRLFNHAVSGKLYSTDRLDDEGINEKEIVEGSDCDHNIYLQ